MLVNFNDLVPGTLVHVSIHFNEVTEEQQKIFTELGVSAIDGDVTVMHHPFIYSLGWRVPVKTDDQNLKALLPVRQFQYPPEMLVVIELKDIVYIHSNAARVEKIASYSRWHLTPYSIVHFRREVDGKSVDNVAVVHPTQTHRAKEVFFVHLLDKRNNHTINRFMSQDNLDNEWFMNNMRIWNYHSEYEAVRFDEIVRVIKRMPERVMETLDLLSHHMLTLSIPWAKATDVFYGKEYSRLQGYTASSVVKEICNLSRQNDWTGFELNLEATIEFVKKITHLSDSVLSKKRVKKLVRQNFNRLIKGIKPTLILK